MAATLSAVFKGVDEISSVFERMASSGAKAVSQWDSASSSAGAAFDRAQTGAEAASKAMQSATASTEQLSKAVGGYDEAAAGSVRTTGELAAQGLKTEEALSAAAQAAEKNTEAAKECAQAADGLREAGERQGQGLGGLQEAHDGLAQGMGKNSEGAKNLQGELGKLSEETNKSRQEFSGLGEEAEKSGEKTGGAVDKLQGVIAAAGIAKLVADITKAVIGMADEFSNASAVIAKSSGATGAQLDSFNRSMMGVFNASKVSDMNQVAGAIGEVNTRLGLQGGELEHVTSLFMDYSRITGTDVVGSIQSVTKVMKNWNVDIRDTEMLLDRLSYAGQASGASVGQLSDMLYNNKAMLDQLGYGLNESLALFSVFELEGIDASAAMAGFRSALKSFTDEGKDASTAMEEIVSRIAAMKGTAEPAGLAIEIFGTKAGPKLADAIQSGRFDIEKMTGAIETSGGTLARTAEAATTLGEKWTQASNKLNTAFSKTLSPSIDAVSSAMAGLAAGFGDWLNDNEWAVALITGIGIALGVVAAAFSAYTIATTIATAVTTAFGVTSMAALWPLYLIAAAIGGVVAVGIALSSWMDEATREWAGLTSTSKKHYEAVRDLEGQYEKAAASVEATAEELSVLERELESARAVYEANKTTMEEFTARHDALMASHRKLVESYTEGMDAIAKEEKGAAALIAKLAELSIKTNLTAGEHQQMSAIIDKLNDQIPDLALSYDSVTGSMNLSIEALREMALAHYDLQRQQEQSEAYVKAIAELPALEQELADAIEQVAAAQETLNNHNALDRGWQSMKEYKQKREDLKNYTAQMEEASAAVAENNAIIAEAESSWEESARAARELAEATAHITAAHAENQKALESAGAATDALIESQRELSEDYRSAMDGIASQEADVSFLVSRLAELSKKTKLTASEQEQMNAVTAKLNRQMPELALAYDKATGALNRSVESIEKMNEAEADKLRYAAQMDIYTDALAAEAKMQEQIWENYDGAQEARRRYNEALAETPDQDLGPLIADIERYQELNRGLQESLRGTRDIIREVEDAWASQVTPVVEYGEAVSEAVSSVSDDLQKLAEEYDKTFEAARKGIDSTVGLFNNMATESKANIQDMMEAMGTQTDFIKNYEHNIKEASRYGITDGLIESLSDGKKDSAEYIDAIVKEYGRLYNEAPEKAAEFVKNFNQQFEGVETAKDSFAATVAEMQTDFSSGMDEIETRMIEAIENMNMEDDAAKAAQETISAYIDQIKSMTGDAYSAAEAVAKAAASALDGGGISVVGVPRYATGTTYAPDMFIAGEEGPELIVGAGGSTVFPAEETRDILSAARHAPVNAAVPDGFGTDSRERARIPQEERKITIDIKGSGKMDVTGADEKTVWEIVAPKLKDAFMGIIRSEIIEEGDRSYAF